MATQHDIVEWCREYLGGALGVDPAVIDPAADFDRLGVDSVVAVALLIEIEERYGVDLSPETLFENPNLNAVATHLADRTERAA